MKSVNKTRKLSLALLLLAVLALTPAAMAATITTDQEDYGPDEIVYISGSGFDIYSVITVTIVGPEEWGTDQFDSLNSPGWVYWSFQEPDKFVIGYLKTKCEGTFTVTATDGTNTATTTFTDSTGISSFTLGTQTGTLTEGAAGSVTYSMLIGYNGTGDITFSVSGLPAGASFSPSSVHVSGSGTYSGNLTITTTASTPAGTYPITVYATDDKQQSTTLSATGTLTIGAVPPTAAFSWSPEPQDEGSPVDFTDESTDSDGTIVSWSWDFDDDGTEDSDEQHPSHTYIVDGIYTVTLTVTDDDGSTNTVSHDVTISNVDTTPPVTGTVNDGLGADIDYQASLTTINANWSGFSDAESGIAGYEWAIGTTSGGTDVQGFISVGTSTSATNATLLLADGAAYFVTVRATNGAGLQITATSDGVIVDATPPEVTINQAVGQDDPTNTSPINFTVVFTEPVADFDAGDVTLGGTASPTTIVVTGSGDTYNVEVSGMASDGTVIASIAAGVAHDTAGNGNTASISIDNTVTYDTTRPTLTIGVSDILINEADAGGTFYVSVIFSEAMDTLATPTIGFDDDVEASGTLTFVSGAWSIGDTVYTASYAIADVDEEATDVDVLVSGSQDLAGNLQNPNPTTGFDLFDVDTIAPTGSITINGDASYTNTVNVILNLAAMDGSGIDAYRVANGTDASGETETTITPILIYIDDVPWILPDGSGTKTVAVQYRDAAGNWSINYTDSIVLIATKSAVTTSSLCYFDIDEGIEGQQFRLIFTQDPTNVSTFKLTASNPGQFYYNVFYVGTPGQTATLTIDVPEPFVTQGAMPVHVYANVGIDGECFIPADEIAVLPAQAGNNPNFEIEVEVPNTGLVYVAIHLDYGLKKTVGYSPYGNNAVSSTKRIDDLTDYDFAVSGDMTDAQAVQNQNVFKKIPGFGGLVLDGDGDPVYLANVTITGPGVSTTVSTDVDGFYYYYYKHKGKDATFTVGCSGQFVPVVMKANRFVEVNFVVP